MNSLVVLVRRWRGESLQLSPPYAEATIRAAFLAAGVAAPKDLVLLYSLIGGMDVPDSAMWRLWPLSEVADNTFDANECGVLFADYFLNSWLYRVKPVDAETSAVYVDYFDGRPCALVAQSLEQFFDMYRLNADALLNQAH